MPKGRKLPSALSILRPLLGARLGVPGQRGLPSRRGPLRLGAGLCRGQTTEPAQASPFRLFTRLGRGLATLTTQCDELRVLLCSLCHTSFEPPKENGPRTTRCAHAGPGMTPRARPPRYHETASPDLPAQLTRTSGQTLHIQCIQILSRAVAKNRNGFRRRPELPAYRVATAPDTGSFPGIRQGT